MVRKLKIVKSEPVAEVANLSETESDVTSTESQVIEHKGPKVRNTRDISDYNVKHTNTSHILHRPDMYCGSKKRFEKKEAIYNFDSNKIEFIMTDIPEAMIRLFLELVTNAADNADTSRRMGTDVGNISLWVDDNILRIKNYGEPIPVEVKQEESDENKCFTLIDEIFGVLYRGSNFNDDEVLKTGAGRNGYGSKLCNLFSKSFTVKVGDNKRGQEHISTWENNMENHVLSRSTPGFYYDKDDSCQVKYTVAGKEVVKDMPGTWKSLANKKNSYKGENYVEVIMEFDFSQFNYDKFPPEAKGIFCRYLIDFSLTSKIPVYFNDVLYDFRNISLYSSLIFTEDEIQNNVLNYTWCNWRGIWKDDKEKVHIEYIDKPKSLSKKENDMYQQIIECKKEEHIPMSELMLLYTPNSSKTLSYVNGLLTIEGGVHVDKAYDIILHKIIDMFNERNGNDKKKKDEGKRSRLTIADVRPHVSMILSCRVIDPQYDSQSKTKLKDPTPEYRFNDKFWEKINTWEIFDLLQAILDAKNYKDVNKGSKKRRGKQHAITVDAANFAGTDKSLKCCLGLVEGQSARGYLTDRICLLRDDKNKVYGQDYNGVLELRGVLLNVSKASTERILANKELQEIERVTNLQKHLDYTLEENLRTLNYGFFLCATDSDDEGAFICSLLLNYFHTYFPTILQMGMFGILMTPSLRLYDGDQIISSFFSEAEYLEWIKRRENIKYAKLAPKWIKGLGTNNKADIVYDLNHAPTVICIYDDEAPKYLNVAFSGKTIEERKQWISCWREATNVEDIKPLSINEFRNLQVSYPLMKKRTITNFINTDLINYTVSSFFRAIPSYKDGLKRSQRQILYYFLQNWNYGNSKKGVMKVNRVANACAEMVSYHHGETSLCMAIIKMGQNYPGSNNMNIVVPSGNFGSRLGHWKRGIGNDHASERYLNTKTEWWCRFIFKKELVELIPRRIVENEEAESVFIPSIIPMHIVNGINGISTGHSTFIPSYNPMDVSRWIIAKCKGDVLPSLTPWFKGFKGNIEILTKQIKKENITETEKEDVYIEEEKNEDDEDEDNIIEEKNNEEYKYSLRTSGILNVTKYKVEEINNVVDGKVVTFFKHTMNVHITELPIGTCITKYVNCLKLLIPKKLLKDVRQQKTSRDEVSILLDGLIVTTGKPFPNEESVIKCLMTKLRMNKIFGMSNIKLIDDKGFPIYFETVQDVMEKYYETMLEVYTKSIEKRLKNAEDQLQDLNMYLKLINCINDKKIIIVDDKGAKTEENIKKQLERNDIPVEYYDKIKLSDLSKTSIFENKIEKQKEKILEVKGENANSLWIKDLEIFMDAYTKHEKSGKKKVNEDFDYDYNNDDDE